ncbi:hypothetical protein C7448_102479 [Tenacibaculum gallaicum]|uniref:Uncharacterized protein n=1 Tax=Tenacibaculum gallaicum TaxID=561505 RepID=A0A3E0I8U7_9FLAO|nr:hypothetical protein C7448_102479 [Tenacibaculum gallaicum]
MARNGSENNYYEKNFIGKTPNSQDILIQNNITY